MRAAQARQERRRTAAIISVAVVVAAAIVGVVVWAQFGQRDEPAQAASAKVGRTSMPPWSVPEDPTAGARAVGLDVGPMEGTAKHFHAHLDILANGKPVQVPANIGIDPASGEMSELHTHDTTGILHIEAPTTNKHYTLGQLFSEWQVGLDAKSVGGFMATGPKALRAYVDGKQVAGNPARIELLPHQEIALVYGPADAKVKPPASYDFPPGV